MCYILDSIEFTFFTFRTGLKDHIDRWSTSGGVYSCFGYVSLSKGKFGLPLNFAVD